MNKNFLLLVLAPFFVSCASVKAPVEVKTSDAAKSTITVDIDDDLFGTWEQVSISCSHGEMSREGKEALTAFKSGMSAAKVVVTSDKIFWDMKEYKDVEKPNDFCQVTIEERWQTKAQNVLIVSDSDVVVTGNGKIVCDKKYTYTKPREHKYKVSEKELSIYLSSTRDALTGVSNSETKLCKVGEVTLNFQRDPAEAP